MGHIEWQITDKKAARMVELGVLQQAGPDNYKFVQFGVEHIGDPLPVEQVLEIAKTMLNPDEDWNPRTGMPE